MNRSLALMLMTLGVAVGCGGSSTSETTPPPSGSGSLGASIDEDQTLSGDVALPASTTISPGVTLTLAAGTKLHASKDAALVVQGTLVAAGDSSAPVVFEATEHGTAGAWAGIEVQSGGKATLNHAEIHDAAMAFQAGAGSSYAIDFLLVDTSEQLAALSADGTIQHSQFHGLGDSQSKSPFAVSSASPQVSDTVIDKGRTGGVDLIVVSGAASAPVFDHVEVANAHCVFHFNEAKGAKLTNSYIHDSSYGMMVEGALGMVVQGNNFEKNGINIGACAGGDVSAVGNYFGGVAAFDGSCAGQSNTEASAATLSGAGPRL
jgi:hypothetical protein